MPEVTRERWYAQAMADAEARFAPLKKALEDRLERPCTVVQTGGMVMCLEVPLGRRTGPDGQPLDYALFSEMPEFDEVSFGVYHLDEQGDLTDVVDTWHVWESLEAVPPGDWAAHPEFCEEVADWAAPIIVAEAAGLAT